MRVLVVGGGSLAYHVCRQFLAKGHAVVLIVEDPIEARDLAQQLDIVVVNGDGADPDLLEDTEAQRMDVAVALCPHDEDNLVFCQIAAKFYSIARTVALVNDPDNRRLFEALGVAHVVSAAEILGAVVEQESVFSGIAGRLPVVPGKIDILEIRLDHDSPATGRTLSELSLPTGALVAAVLREGEVVIPRGGLGLVAGDELLVVSQPECQAEALGTLLGSKK